MRGLFLIAANFLRLAFDKKAMYLLFFVAPVASFVAMTSVAIYAEKGGVAIGYVDEDRGELGGELIRYLAAGGGGAPLAVPAGKAKERILEGRIALCLAIPADFSELVAAGGAPSVAISSLQGEAATASVAAEIDFFVESRLAIARAAGSDAERAAALGEALMAGAAALEVVGVRDAAARREGGAMGFGYFLFMIMAQASVFARLTLKEREAGTFLRIRVAPVREAVYGLGNMLAAFAVIAAQIALSLLVLVAVLRFDLTVPPVPALALLLAFSAAAIGLGIMLASFAASTAQADLALNLTAIISCMLSGCFWPSAFEPEIVRRLSSLFPQSWALRAVERMQEGSSFASVAYTIPLLLAFGLLFLSIYAYRMRHGQDQRVYA